MPKTTENWEEMIRSDFYPYNTSIGFYSIKYSNEFLGGPKYRKILLYIKDKNTAYYYENFVDHFRIGNYCLNLFIDDKKLFGDYLKFWNAEFKKLNLICAKIKKVDAQKLNTAELSKLMEQLYKQMIYWEGVAYNVDAIDVVLSPLIEKLIVKVFPNDKKSKLSAYYNALTFPKVISYINRMHLEKLELFKIINKTGWQKNQKKVEKFINDYYWVNFTWGGGEEYTIENFRNEMNGLELKKLNSSFLTLSKNLKSSLKEKNKLLQKIAKKEPLIRDYINIFDRYAVLHDLRKEGQMKSVYYLKKIYDEIGKKMAIKDNLIYYLWPQELLNYIKKNKKIDIALLKKRSSGWFCEYLATGKYKEFYGKEALKQRDIVIGLDNLKQQKELQGTGASQGRIFGTAKVALDAKTAIKKIQEGDILITGMTMPDFISAMKRASAVVTDEGGLTCHAAIICRELGKPCVVGTKFATRLIKDGDKIEVNANHGVVKIL